MKKLNKKVNWAIGLSIVAIILWVKMFVLWCCNAKGFSAVNLDTFVGVIVALLAVIVTIAIGWQIYNAVEMRNKLAKLDKLEENLKRQQSKFENFADDMICENLLTIAEMRRVIDKYAFAYMYATESLVYGLSANHNDIDYIVRFLGRCVRLIKSQTNIPQDTYNRIVKADKLIRRSNLFHIIGKTYTQTYNEFMSKVIVRNEYSYDMEPDED